MKLMKDSNDASINLENEGKELNERLAKQIWCFYSQSLNRPQTPLKFRLNKNKNNIAMTSKHSFKVGCDKESIAEIEPSLNDIIAFFWNYGYRVSIELYELKEVPVMDSFHINQYYIGQTVYDIASLEYTIREIVVKNNALVYRVTPFGIDLSRNNVHLCDYEEENLFATPINAKRALLELAEKNYTKLKEEIAKLEGNENI